MKERIDLVNAWFAKAENDLKAIELIMADEDPPTDIACFHAQQATEKYLKGFLLFHQIKFPKIHDLESLIELCKQLDSDFEQLMEIAADLSDFSVKIRYPDDFYIPSIAEAKEALASACRVKDMVLRKLERKR